MSGFVLELDARSGATCVRLDFVLDDFAVHDFDGAGLGDLCVFRPVRCVLSDAGSRPGMARFLVLFARVIFSVTSSTTGCAGLMRSSGRIGRILCWSICSLVMGAIGLQDLGTGRLVGTFWQRLQAGGRDRLEVLHVAWHDGAARLF